MSKKKRTWRRVIVQRIEFFETKVFADSEEEALKIARSRLDHHKLEGMTYLCALHMPMPDLALPLPEDLPPDDDYGDGGKKKYKSTR
jgi:hypothetical protein